jgi:hypothetical protein
LVNVTLISGCAARSTRKKTHVLDERDVGAVVNVAIDAEEGIHHELLPVGAEPPEPVVLGVFRRRRRRGVDLRSHRQVPSIRVQAADLRGACQGLAAAVDRVQLGLHRLLAGGQIGGKMEPEGVGVGRLIIAAGRLDLRRSPRVIAKQERQGQRAGGPLLPDKPHVLVVVAHPQGLRGRGPRRLRVHHGDLLSPPLRRVDRVQRVAVLQAHLRLAQRPDGALHLPLDRGANDAVVRVRRDVDEAIPRDPHLLAGGGGQILLIGRVSVPRALGRGAPAEGEGQQQAESREPVFQGHGSRLRVSARPVVVNLPPRAP